MSQNMVVNCEIKDKGLLIEVLTDLSIGHLSGSNLSMCGYDGSVRPEKADIVIDRRTIKQRFYGVPNDLGFRFAGGKAEMIISEYDAAVGKPGRRMANEIMQEYARRRVVAQAHARGYEVESIEKDPAGNLRVILTPQKRSARPRARVYARREA